jgi:hypothetical protein
MLGREQVTAGRIHAQADDLASGGPDVAKTPVSQVVPLM